MSTWNKFWAFFCLEQDPREGLENSCSGQDGSRAGRFQGRLCVWVRTKLGTLQEIQPRYMNTEPVEFPVLWVRNPWSIVLNMWTDNTRNMNTQVLRCKGLSCGVSQNQKVGTNCRVGLINPFRWSHCAQTTRPILTCGFRFSIPNWFWGWRKLAKGVRAQFIDSLNSFVFAWILICMPCWRDFTCWCGWVDFCAKWTKVWVPQQVSRDSTKHLRLWVLHIVPFLCIVCSFCFNTVDDEMLDRCVASVCELFEGCRHDPIFQVFVSGLCFHSLFEVFWFVSLFKICWLGEFLESILGVWFVCFIQVLRFWRRGHEEGPNLPLLGFDSAMSCRCRCGIWFVQFHVLPARPTSWCQRCGSRHTRRLSIPVWHIRGQCVGSKGHARFKIWTENGITSVPRRERHFGKDATPAHRKQVCFSFASTIDSNSDAFSCSSEMRAWRGESLAWKFKRRVDVNCASSLFRVQMYRIVCHMDKTFRMSPMHWSCVTIASRHCRTRVWSWVGGQVSDDSGNGERQMRAHCVIKWKLFVFCADPDPSRRRSTEWKLHCLSSSVQVASVQVASVGTRHPDVIYFSPLGSQHDTHLFCSFFEWERDFEKGVIENGTTCVLFCMRVFVEEFVVQRNLVWTSSNKSRTFLCSSSSWLGDEAIWSSLRLWHHSAFVCESPFLKCFRARLFAYLSSVSKVPSVVSLMQVMWKGFFGFVAHCLLRSLSTGFLWRHCSLQVAATLAHWPSAKVLLFLSVGGPKFVNVFLLTKNIVTIELAMSQFLHILQGWINMCNEICPFECGSRRSWVGLSCPSWHLHQFWWLVYRFSRNKGAGLENTGIAEMFMRGKPCHLGFTTANFPLFRIPKNFSEDFLAGVFRSRTCGFSIGALFPTIIVVRIFWNFHVEFNGKLACCWWEGIWQGNMRVSSTFLFRNGEVDSFWMMVLGSLLEVIVLAGDLEHSW